MVKQFYTKQEARAYLKISLSAFIRIAKNNELKAYRIKGSRLVRYETEDIHNLLS